MEQTLDITKRQFDFMTHNMDVSIKTELEIKSYTHNGTLAILLMRTQPFPEEMEDCLKYGSGEKFSEHYGTVTVNLESSERLQPNVQFVDENNLPGIGDWLEKNGIAQPTGLMVRSGYCLYPAYEFNLTQEKINEIMEIRRKINPVQTESVLKEMEKGKLLDIQDSVDKCMTLGELKETWLTMPEQLRDKISFPDKISIEGEDGHTLKEWEQMRFTAPIPEGLPAYSYTEARIKLDERKERIIQDGCSHETIPTPEGELTRFGDIEMDQVTYYFPTEYSNPFFVEERSENGRLTKEYIAIDTSYNDNIKNGPCIEHINGNLTTFTMYSADINSNICLMNASCTFSPKGSLIAVKEGDYGPSCGHIQQTDKYHKAVDSCKKSLNNGLEKIISNMEFKSETQQKSKGPRR